MTTVAQSPAATLTVTLKAELKAVQQAFIKSPSAFAWRYTTSVMLAWQQWQYAQRARFTDADRDRIARAALADRVDMARIVVREVTGREVEELLA